MGAGAEAMATLCSSWWSMKNKASAVGPLTFSVQGLSSRNGAAHSQASLSLLSYTSLEPPKSHTSFQLQPNQQWRWVMMNPPLANLLLKYTTFFLKLIQNFWEFRIWVAYLYYFVSLLSPLPLSPCPPTPSQIYNVFLKLLYILFIFCIYKYSLLSLFKVAHVSMSSRPTTGIG